MFEVGKEVVRFLRSSQNNARMKSSEMIDQRTLGLKVQGRNSTWKECLFVVNVIPALRFWMVGMRSLDDRMIRSLTGGIFCRSFSSVRSGNRACAR